MAEFSQEFLERFDPLDNAHETADSLPYDKQRKLDIARALATEANLLMLDEPSLGLAPKFIGQIFNIITRINRDNGVTIFLVEQNANEALLHAHRGYVLENGRITLEGSANDLCKDPRVIEAYLGI